MASILSHPVPHTGFGLMGLSWRPKPQPLADSIETMHAALELGSTYWNAGELYGTPDYNSLHILSAYFDKHPQDASKILICIKGGTNRGTIVPNGSEENVKRSIDECLKFLDGKKKLDIFEMARVDQGTGNETAMRVLSEYVKDGKLGGIGLSEVNATTIRKAVEQCGPGVIVSVEVEVSLWTPDIFHNGIAATCAELGLPIFAYSPLARGALTESPIRKNADLPEGDMRKALPRFQDEALEANNRIVDAVRDMAKKKNATAPQIAIGWLRGQSQRTKKVRDDKGAEKEIQLPVIIPIPGATTVERVKENFTVVELSEEELMELDALVEKYPVQGERYHKHGMAHVNG